MNIKTTIRQLQQNDVLRLLVPGCAGAALGIFLAVYGWKYGVVEQERVYVRESAPGQASVLRLASPYFASRSPTHTVAIAPLHPSAPVEEDSTGNSDAYDVPPMPDTSSKAGNDALDTESFPEFGKAIYPVARTPNWGAMRTPDEWNRTYSQMTDADFVSVPSYNLQDLTKPVSGLMDSIDDPETQRILTEKLFYSTRFFGAYDLDSAEFTAIHPGIDLKLARGTPLGAIAGGRVNSVSTNAELGLHVVIEHRAPDGKTYYSIYGHLDSASLWEGDDVSPGDTVGFVGMTGNTSAPHVHLQVDRGQPGEHHHVPYLPTHMPTAAEADEFVVNPIWFIATY